MIKVFEELYVGAGPDCDDVRNNSNWSIIHACKIPCHKNALDYEKSLPSSDPHYLVFSEGRHLYLNLVDMTDIQSEFADPIFKAALNFLYQASGKILVHCNQGISRSPSIALVFLAKKGVIKNDSYVLACSEFHRYYQNYNPGSGIRSYLQLRWDYLMDYLPYQQKSSY